MVDSVSPSRQTDSRGVLQEHVLLAASRAQKPFCFCTNVAQRYAGFVIAMVTLFSPNWRSA